MYETVGRSEESAISIGEGIVVVGGLLMWENAEEMKLGTRSGDAIAALRSSYDFTYSASIRKPSFQDIRLSCYKLSQFVFVRQLRSLHSYCSE